MAAFKPIGWLKGEDLQDLPGDDRKKKWRERLFTALAILLAAIAIAGGAWWYFVSSNYVTTDNAYVDVSAAQVTPLTSGAALSVPVHDTQMVRRGEVLLVIDPADARLLLAQADAAYGLTVRKVETYFAAVAARRADYERTRLDYDRRVNLVKSGAVSGEELTAVKNNFDSAKAALDAALALTRGTSVMTNPEVLAAKAALDTARLNLDRTVVRAPVDGLVAQRQVQIGQRVQAGMPVMAIIPISQVYVDANYKEDQLGKVRPGQGATLTSDLYGSSVTYHGRVMGIGGGTGSAFAVIPAQEATGNWIKVVQRIPVRISLEQSELKDHPLRVGLSMSVSIDVSKTE